MYIMNPFSKICNKDLATRQLQQIWLSYFVTSARYAYLTIISHICRWCAREMSFSGVLRDRDVLNNWNILTLMYVYDDRFGNYYNQHWANQICNSALWNGRHWRCWFLYYLYILFEPFIWAHFILENTRGLHINSYTNNFRQIRLLPYKPFNLSPSKKPIAYLFIQENIFYYNQLLQMA